MRRLIAKIWCGMMARYDAKSEAGRTLPGDIAEERDVPVPGGQLLDFYRPEGSDGLPLVVDVHGGGLMYGNKELNKRFCYAIASLGCEVANVDYRLAPAANLRDMVSDVCRAVRFARRMRPTDKLILAGDSAGAFLALTADAAAKCPEVREAFGLTERDVGCPADGLLLISGMYCFRKSGVRALAGVPVGKGGYMKYTYMPALLDVYSPPPVFMTSSEGDFLRRASLRADALLTERGVPHEFDYKGKSAGGHKYVHVYPVRDPEWRESRELLARSMAFLTKR